MKKRKAGEQPPTLELAALIADPDNYLFANGQTVADYFVTGTMGYGLIGFNHNGRDYDLLVEDDELARVLRNRLIELGVEQRD